MTEDELLRIGALLVLFVLSAFFSGSETALTALNRIRLKSMVEKEKEGAEKLEKLIDDPSKLLSTILVGNNLVNIAASVFAAGLFVSLYGEKGELLTILVLTPVLLVFSEILPKTYAANNPEKVSFLVRKPIAMVMWILTPVLFVVTRFTKLVSKILGHDEDGDLTVSEDEIRTMISVGEQSGVVAEEKHRMLHGIFELAKVRVREVMIPRTEAIAIDADSPFEDMLLMVQSSRHSRFPVFRDTLDNILGVIHSKDILRFVSDPALFNIEDACRAPIFVPESKRIETLLQSFRQERVHLAIVVDEYGGVEGIVTLEDIVEEIVGEIQDEYDFEQALLHEVSANRYVVDAGISIRALNGLLSLSLSEEDATTLAGFVLKSLGSIPSEGDSFSFENVRLSVKSMEDRRIEEVELELVIVEEQDD